MLFDIFGPVSIRAHNKTVVYFNSCMLAFWVSDLLGVTFGFKLQLNFRYHDGKLDA